MNERLNELTKKYEQQDQEASLPKKRIKSKYVEKFRNRFLQNMEHQQIREKIKRGVPIMQIQPMLKKKNMKFSLIHHSEHSNNTNRRKAKVLNQNWRSNYPTLTQNSNICYQASGNPSSMKQYTKTPLHETAVTSNTDTRNIKIGNINSHNLPLRQSGKGLEKQYESEKQRPGKPKSRNQKKKICNYDSFLSPKHTISQMMHTPTYGK